LAGALKIGRLLLAAIGFTLAGCAKGPIWQPNPLTLPALLPHEKIKTAIVSGFHLSLYDEYEVGILKVAATRDDTPTDVSVEIASALRKAGIDARAVPNARPEALQAGEVLVRGAIRGVRPVNAESFQGCVFCCTVDTYRGVVPFLAPMREVIVFEVHVEVLDSKNNVLMGTTQEATGTYTVNSVWAMPAAQNRTGALVQGVKGQAVAALAQRLRE